jgi:HlyD family secretion protein
VFVVENGVAKAVPVKRGISDDAFTEITEGIDEGTQVVSGTYKAINRELEDGAKVRIEEPKKPGMKKPGEGA